MSLSGSNQLNPGVGRKFYKTNEPVSSKNKWHGGRKKSEGRVMGNCYGFEGCLTKCNVCRSWLEQIKCKKIF